MVNISIRPTITFSNHKEFHLYYLTKHTDVWCKRLHLLGTLAAAAGAVCGAVRGDVKTVAGSIAGGLAAAWVGDYAFQKDTPTTFKYPLWSLMSNMKITMAMLKGDMSI